MAKNVNIDNFASEVVSMMKQYTEDVEEALSDEIKIIGDEGVDMLKSVQMPTGNGGTAIPSERESWSNYSNKWKNKYSKENNYSSSIIHNSRYQLTHLLEYGHATRNGTTTRAFPHVKPVEEKLEKKLLENTKKIIEKGGKI